MAWFERHFSQESNIRVTLKNVNGFIGGTE